MKKFLLYLFVAGVVSGFTADLSAFDTVSRWFRERYDRFMLGNALYNELSNQCSTFETNPQGRRNLLNRVYQAPWWVGKMKTFSSQESLFSYAQGIYRDIVQIMEQLEKDLKVIKADIFEINLGTSWGTLHQTLNQIIGEDESRGITVTEAQIQQNIDAAVKILGDFKNKLITMTENGTATPPRGVKNPSINTPSTTSSEQVERRNVQLQNAEKTSNEVDAALEKISLLRKKQRLTWLERWHKNALLERAAQYVYTRCPLK